MGEGACVRLKLCCGKSFKPVCPPGLCPLLWHQESHTSCQSLTQACVQLRVLPGAFHCSRFTLDSPHLRDDTTEGPSQTQLCRWIWRRSCCCRCSPAPAGSCIAQCVLSSQFLRLTLEIFAFCETLTEPKRCRRCCPPLWLLNKRAAAAFSPEPASHSSPGPGWGIYCTGTLTTHTLDLHHHLNTTQ